MIKVFTHNDGDGLGCGILAKHAFGEEVSVSYCTYETKNPSPHSINKQVKDFLKNPDNQNATIYITDISVSDEVALLLDEHFKKGNYVKLIDHHNTAIHFNKYPWGQVQEFYSETKKTAATSLFYEYLVETGKLQANGFLGEFVELTRSYDTWEWDATNDLKAKRLNDLLYLIGVSAFEESILQKAVGENLVSFEFNEVETMLLDMEENKINRYIETKNKQMVEVWFDEFKVGVIHAEQYHSELGNNLGKLNTHLHFIAIIMMSQGKMSLRTIHDDVDVSKIARHFGGGGHPKASGCPLNKEALERLVLTAYEKTPNKKDAPLNRYNLKDSQHEKLYLSKEDEMISIFKNNLGKWVFEKNKMINPEQFSSFDEVEKFVKRSFDAYLAFDEFYINYLSEKYSVKKEKLMSQFERTMKEVLI